METSFLSSLAFPWLLLSNGEVTSQGDGSLFKLDDGLTPSDLNLAEFKSGVWVKSAKGYAAYAFTLKRIGEHLVVLHGLKVNGVSTAQGKSKSLSIRLDRENVEQYVEEFSRALESLDETYKAQTRENIHEIRGINSSLYNAAYELQQRLDGIARLELIAISKNVVGLSQILTGRIDYMDFIANPATEGVKKSDIAVYKKFDKVQKCFRVTAAAKKVGINFSGSGTGTVKGPPIFDLIPYLLIENAVKYAPDGSGIDVICTETRELIRVEVRSIGPKVMDDEIPHIFSPGVRGQMAKRSGRSGTGLGLSVLKRLVENVFDGTISFSQMNERIGPNNLPYCHTTFEVTFEMQ